MFPDLLLSELLLLVISASNRLNLDSMLDIHVKNDSILGFKAGNVLAPAFNILFRLSIFVNKFSYLQWCKVIFIYIILDTNTRINVSDEDKGIKK